MSTDTVKPKYAWCSLVMLGDNYVPGALVAAYSLKKVETKYPVLCMVTYDVTADARESLLKCFDGLVEIPYLEHTTIPMRSHKQRDIYGAWMNKSFTKWNVLNPELLPYEKVIFFDADMYVVKNIDHLFDIPGPAGTFSSPWAAPYVKNGYYNPYTDAKGGELAHGAPVPNEMIKDGLRPQTAMGFVWHASLVLVMPNNIIWAQYKKILNNKAPYGWKYCASGFDEQVLAELYLQAGVQMYNIHQMYNWIIGKYDWIDEPAHVFQYYNKLSAKPWNVNRATWDDLRAWWDFADKLAAENASLAKYFIEPPVS